jgi:hypothetical protein
MPKRDIVERLRDGKIDIAYRDRLIAASEIERLRAALREILFESSTIQQAAAIARAALERKK